MTQLWTNERIKNELNATDQWADVMALVFEMRDEYEARIAESMSAITLANTALDLGGEHVEELKAEINVANARIAMLSEEVAMLYSERGKNGGDKCADNLNC